MIYAVMYYIWQFVKIELHVCRPLKHCGYCTRVALWLYTFYKVHVLACWTGNLKYKKVQICVKLYW